MSDPGKPASAMLATDYILRRSADEAKRAILATDSRARAAHEEMCHRYVGLAIARLSGSDGQERHGTAYSAASKVSAA